MIKKEKIISWCNALVILILLELRVCIVSPVTSVIEILIFITTTIFIDYSKCTNEFDRVSYWVLDYSKSLLLRLKKLLLISSWIICWLCVMFAFFQLALQKIVKLRFSIIPDQTSHQLVIFPFSYGMFFSFLAIFIA